jgi:hypothetical protein
VGPRAMLHAMYSRLPALNLVVLKGDAHLPPYRESASRPVLLGHTKIESTVRYLGIDVDDALAIAEQVDV